MTQEFSCRGLEEHVGWEMRGIVAVSWEIICQFHSALTLLNAYPSPCGVCSLLRVGSTYFSLVLSMVNRREKALSMYV
jgi:hypothetical protein